RVHRYCQALVLAASQAALANLCEQRQVAIERGHCPMLMSRRPGMYRSLLRCVVFPCVDFFALTFRRLGKIEVAPLDAISEHLVRPRRYNKGARFAVDIRVGSRDSAERYAQLEHAIFGVSVSGILKGVASSLRLLGLRAFVERPPPSHNWRIGWIRL